MVRIVARMGWNRNGLTCIPSVKLSGISSGFKLSVHSFCRSLCHLSIKGTLNKNVSFSLHLKIPLSLHLQAYRKPPSNFIDQLRVYVRGGGGGQGLPKYGGRGGDGGCVYVEAVPRSTLQNLKRSNIKKRFIAARGESSS